MKKKLKAYEASFLVPATKKIPAYTAKKQMDAFSITEAQSMAASLARQQKVEVKSVIYLFTY